jgi:uncharacterized protein (TIGR02118 family)
MVVLSVMYPATGRFDLDYYTQRHIKLVRERWGSSGLQDVRLLRGAASPDGGPAPFTLIALISFGSERDFRNALTQHGAELLADIKNFTDSQPVLQLNQQVDV